MADQVTGRDPSLRVAILGAGQVAQRHVGAFAGLSESTKIVGVADVDRSRAEALAASCGARAFGDYRDLLALGPDVAVVCLPHSLHREAGVAAAEAGSHILIEKPLATSIEDAQAVIAACHRRGVRLGVGFVHRYRQEWQLARQIIDRGQLGKPRMVLDVFGLPGGGHVPRWVWADRRSGGGILMYSGIHSIDWQCSLIGSPVREVYAGFMSHHRDTDAEDGVVATWTFANGAHGTLIGNQPGYAVTPRTRAFELYGSHGMIRIRNGEFLEFSSEEQAYRVDVSRDDPFLSQAREFVAAVREDREPWIGGADGLHALAVILAIYRSAEVGRPVAVEDVLPV